MIELAQSLQNKDPGFLRIVADLWEIDIMGSAVAEAQPRELASSLAQAILDRQRVADMVAWLPADGRAVLEELAKNNGLLPWPVFVRQFGRIREMGPARRDREQPHLQPSSTAELLWYRGLITRAFLDTPNGARNLPAYLQTYFSHRPNPNWR